MDEKTLRIIDAFIDAQSEMTCHPLRQTFAPQQKIVRRADELIGFRRKQPEQYRRIVALLKGVGIVGLG